MQYMLSVSFPSTCPVPDTTPRAYPLPASAFERMRCGEPAKTQSALLEPDCNPASTPRWPHSLPARFQWIVDIWRCPWRRTSTESSRSFYTTMWRIMERKSTNDRRICRWLIALSRGVLSSFIYQMYVLCSVMCIFLQYSCSRTNKNTFTLCKCALHLYTIAQTHTHTKCRACMTLNILNVAWGQCTAESQ